jgi:3-hydroxyisobutyrate dehydrogenase-like beta-hydroxyacid dehydrogenase/alkylhydroperoxidase/carboxymuconolactone decarboxylase family protein YurZ
MRDREGELMPTGMNEKNAKTPVRAGVIGLGMIGGGVAANLAASTVPVSVYDVRADAIEGLDGVDTIASSPAEVARDSDVIIVAVVNAQQARDVLTGEEGILTGSSEGTIVVLVSTVSVPVVEDLAAECADHGVGFLDAGVTQAGEGKLVVMLGGDEDIVDRARPALEPFARELVYCGKQGTGMVTKLARNMITYGNWAVVREAVSLAKAGGVDPSTILGVVDAAAASGSSPTSLLRRQIEAQSIPAEQVVYADALAQKDLGAAQDFAGQAGVQTPIADVVRPKMAEVYGGVFDDELPTDPWERGVEMMQRVYGQHAPQVPRGTGAPAADDTVENLFARVWARGHLTTRDRRLLVLGATTMLGRQDLLETQLRGAIDNGELTVPQLREMEYFLNYYTGVQNGAGLLTVIEKLIAETAEKKHS